MSFFNSFGRKIGRYSRLKKSSIGTYAQGSQQDSRKLFLCQPFIKTALVKGNFATIVALPKYIDLNEWLALNGTKKMLYNPNITGRDADVFEFFTYLNQFYGVFAEFCTPQNCSSMSAGTNVNYMWFDNNRKQIQLPAPQYIDYVLAWVNNRLSDENTFPTKAGHAFPPNFFVIVKSMYKQLFRVFAHIYHSHFDQILHLSLEAHWNSFFAHFISFGKEFELLDKYDIDPLRDLIDLMIKIGIIA
ncbi:hypothetical protein PORY_002187 [Pneumocystis oryctolagi]|uniref:Uncharacterized protein n=1 Tax=Pneumocystis oryctolagi TaxID=42067 RepID=A0ACB7CBP0_9ASCO|nr:hypothetical protein PORY_002187 [Pneumocystis oryctolagi]